MPDPLRMTSSLGFAMKAMPTVMEVYPSGTKRGLTIHPDKRN
jgi:hypothetical protein